MVDFSKMREQELYKHDDKIFKEMLEEWEVKALKTKVVFLENGLGDHIVFRKILPEIQKRYDKVIVSCCYPEVFEDDDVEVISIAEGIGRISSPEEYDVYKKGWDMGLKTEYLEAFKNIYL